MTDKPLQYLVSALHYTFGAGFLFYAAVSVAHASIERWYTMKIKLAKRRKELQDAIGKK